MAVIHCIMTFCCSSVKARFLNCLHNSVSSSVASQYSLPNTPKYVCDVELEARTHIRVGEVNPLEGWGSGDGTQCDLIGQRLGDFKNERLLEGN